MGEDHSGKAGQLYHRRSARPRLRIPIQVKGKDAGGKPFSETTYTLAVNRNGARISLQKSLRPGDHITITNLQRMQETCQFRVIGRTATPMGQESEWGIECLEPDRNFWGVYFPEKREEPSKPEVVDALLECGTCHAREMVEITLDQYHELIALSSLFRPCHKCRMKTAWKFGSVQVTHEEAASPGLRSILSALFPPGRAERRRTKRSVVLLPVSIRGRDGKEEVTRTENLSKLGISFMSDLTMHEGDTVFLTVGRDPGVKQPARIVWRRPSGEKGRALYGVKLEETD